GVPGTVTAVMPPVSAIGAPSTFGESPDAGWGRRGSGTGGRRDPRGGGSDRDVRGVGPAIGAVRTPSALGVGRVPPGPGVRRLGRSLEQLEVEAERGEARHRAPGGA